MTVLISNEIKRSVVKVDEDPWIMYFVVRQDLGLTPGKTAAQVAHCLQLMCKYFYHSMMRDDFRKEYDAFVCWEQSSFRKLVKRAKPKKFNKIKEELPVFLIRDAGLTEVEEGAETVLGLWPMKRSQTPKLIKNLQLL